MIERADAVVVGAGPAGCAAARTLADAGLAVALVESGAGWPYPESVTGIDTVAAAGEGRHLWPELVVGRNGGYRQGRGVGGGSLVNSLVLSPGDRADYDRWADELGCTGWGAAEMAPWLQRAADRVPMTGVDPGPLSLAVERAAAESGHAVGGTSIEADRPGMLRAVLAASSGRRVSAVHAYLDPPPDGLTVVPNTTVDRVVRDGAGRRVLGVETADGWRLDAPLVVLAAGALRTPLVLMRSGLIDAAVGAPLKDHPSFAFTVALRAGGEPATSRPRAVSRLLRWSSGGASRGDLQASVIDRIGDDDGPPLAVVAVGLLAVASTGRVAAGPAGPSFDAGLLTDADDRRRFRVGVRHAAELLASEPVTEVAEAVLIDDVGTPLDRLRSMSDAELDRWLADHPGPYAHVGASCPLGPTTADGLGVGFEPGGFGAIAGCEGLRVADASVLPDLVSGGLHLPVAAMAERIAADIVVAV